MIQLKDIIQYYIGRWYWTENSEGETNAHTLPNVLDMIKREKKVQLYLRRLEDMDEFEAVELARLQIDPKRHSNVDVLFIEKERIHYMDGSKWTGDGVEEFYDLYVYYNQLNATQFHYLLKQGFDLFNLIPSGQAIDSKTLNQKA